MHASAVKHLPVVDDKGRLVGIIGRLDVLRTIASGLERRSGENLPRLPQESTAVADIMERDVARLPETAPLFEVGECLLASAAHRVVVTDEAKQPLGIITPSDLIARIDPESRPGLLRLLQSRWSEAAKREVRKTTGRRAQDIMSTPVVSVLADEPIVGALRLMVDRHLKHLPVVDSGGCVVGLVSRQAVLAASFAGTSSETP
jgi:CBS-domain-containing membrane protein